VLVVLVEDVVQDAFSFDVQGQVLLPDLTGGSLVGVIGGVELWDDDEFLEGVVEMLLVVVEGRIGDLLNLFLLICFQNSLFISLLVSRGGGFFWLDGLLMGWLSWQRCLVFQIQKLLNVFDGIVAFQERLEVPCGHLPV
jgi:hypothetical protein